MCKEYPNKHCDRFHQIWRKMESPLREVSICGRDWNWSVLCQFCLVVWGLEGRMAPRLSYLMAICQIFLHCLRIEIGVWSPEIRSHRCKCGLFGRLRYQRGTLYLWLACQLSPSYQISQFRVWNHLSFPFSFFQGRRLYYHNFNIKMRWLSAKRSQYRIELSLASSTPESCHYHSQDIFRPNNLCVDVLLGLFWLCRRHRHHRRYRLHLLHPTHPYHYFKAVCEISSLHSQSHSSHPPTNSCSHSTSAHIFSTKTSSYSQGYHLQSISFTTEI